jgi:VanZ family protein
MGNVAPQSRFGLLMSGAAAAVWVGLMLFAGLFPFTFAPKNNVVFNPRDSSISFSRPAAAFDADTFTQTEKRALSDSTVTIAFRIRSAGYPLWRISRIMSIDEGNRLRFEIGQWHNSLVVQSFSGDLPLGSKREMSVLGILDSGATRNIGIVTGPGGTKISVDGKLTRANPDFHPFSDTARGPWRIAIGGSLSGKYTWKGTLFCFTIFPGNVVGLTSARDYLGLENAERAYGSIVKFTFDKQPVAAPGMSGRHELVVRPRFPVVPEVLVSPWNDFTNDASYYADIAVNVIGFLPFGFFFALFLLQRFTTSRWKTVVAVAATGLLISLSIELLQVFIPGRSSQLSDVMTDTFGTLVGACVCLVAKSLAKKRSAFTL